MNEDFIGTYIKWLKDNMSVKNMRDDVVELTVPFVDRHNDYLQIYISKKDNEFILSDDGYTINDLKLSGLDIDTPNRRITLSTVLNGFNTALEKDAIITRCDSSNLAFKKHSIIQAMLAVNDMYVISRPNVMAYFHEDVESFLNYNDIRNVPKISLAGKSGFIHSFDFGIPKSKESPERFLKVSNSPNKDFAKSTIFGWNDTKNTRGTDTKLYAFLNDIDSNVSSDVIEALKNYDIVPLFWSKKNNYIGELAA